MKYVCSVCGYVYNGDVSFDELSEDFTCPMCGVGKSDFEESE